MNTFYKNSLLLIIMLAFALKGEGGSSKFKINLSRTITYTEWNLQKTSINNQKFSFDTTLIFNSKNPDRNNRINNNEDSADQFKQTNELETDSANSKAKYPPEIQNISNTLLCHDTAYYYLYPGFEKQLQIKHIIKQYPSGIPQSSVNITLQDEFGQYIDDKRFKYQDIGKKITATAKIIGSNSFCTTAIKLDSCPYYQFCDTLCYNQPGVECKEGIFSQLKWPCDITLSNCVGPTPVHYEPSKLVEITGLDMSNFWPQLNNLECQSVSVVYGDQIINTLNERIINRTFRVFHDDINESRTYVQKIILPFTSLSICDILPRDTPIGDCSTGHSSDDMVEWPSEIEVVDTFIDLFRLEAKYLYGLVPGYENIKPNFENVCAVPDIEYSDKLYITTDTSLIYNRTWNVIDPITLNEFSYVQKVHQILKYKSEICLFDILGNKLKHFDLDSLSTPSIDSIYYNDFDCIELILDRVRQGYFVLNVEELHTPNSMDGINILDYMLIWDEYVNDLAFSNKLAELASLFLESSFSAYKRNAMLKSLTGQYHNIGLGQWIMVDTTQTYYNFGSIDGPSVHTATVLYEKPNYEFILIKSGDINFSEVYGDSIAGEFKLLVQDEIINSGEIYEVHFLIPEDTVVRAFQLEFNEFKPFASNITWKTNQNVTNVYSTPDSVQLLDKYIICGNFPSVLPIERKAGDTLFTLQFRALKNGVLSEMISLYPSENNLAVMPIGQLPKEIKLEWKDRIINNNVSEIELESIHVFPNPASDFLEIKGVSSDLTYQITDLLGKTCNQGNLTDETKLDVHHLSRGMYILLLEDSNKKRKSLKFFVAK